MSKVAISLEFCSLLRTDEYKLPVVLKNIASIWELTIVYIKNCCKT